MRLPIRQLTLYKHGIGVVVRGGAVSGTSATLTFHKEQMNDVLKSLVAWDRGGGQAGPQRGLCVKKDIHAHRYIGTYVHGCT